MHWSEHNIPCVLYCVHLVFLSLLHSELHLVLSHLVHQAEGVLLMTALPHRGQGVDIPVTGRVKGLIHRTTRRLSNQSMAKLPNTRLDLVGELNEN